MNTVVRAAVGAVVGGALGWLLYRFVGCRTGACPLMGSPYVAVTIWALIGAALAAK